MTNLYQLNRGDAFKIVKSVHQQTVNLNALEMGIHPNAEGVVLQKQKHALVVNIDGTRLAIGMQQAQNLQVEVQ